ncbi:MAG TPA: penicillin-binding transpeptidase domain-containing protein [Polyangiales bacterium]|nr:penicillin-binding transpeptidase domain-containing protein [Polyangiales bacterium]
MFRYRNGTRDSLCAAAVALVWLSSPRSAADDDADARREQRAAAAPTAHAKAASRKPALDVRTLIAHGRRDGTKWVADAAERRVELTLSPDLQDKARQIFEQYRVPYAAMAAIEPSTGRMLGYVGHSLEAGSGDPVRDPSPPAASVFKLVTASALVDAGVSPTARTCFFGGKSRIDKANLQDNPRRDHSCASLDEALGKSLNCVFAKLADRHLDAAKLHSYGRAFGFGHVLPFELAPPASPFEVPGDRLEFARAAAGFWHTQMSPLHAALIAATIANDGAMPIPFAVQAESGRRGSRRVISPNTARAVGHMMLRTVSDGTSRSAFLDQRGRPILPGISVAGKTGSLSASNPYRAYSWWVGFAPADKPRIALAVLVVNSALWRIKSSFVARELLREYLSLQPRPRAEVAHTNPRARR